MFWVWVLNMTSQSIEKQTEIEHLLKRASWKKGMFFLMLWCKTDNVAVNKKTKYPPPYTLQVLL